MNNVEYNKYNAVLEDSTKTLTAYIKTPMLYNNEMDILKLESARYEIMYLLIHSYLALQKTEECEKEILRIIKIIFKYDKVVCESKIDKFEKEKVSYTKRKMIEQANLSKNFKQNWEKLYENYYALIAFRSLEHFAIFMEWDKPKYDKMWEYSIDTFGDNGYSGCTKGFFYYANKMVLNDDIKFIMKQLPTSFGKSYSDSEMIAFIFGFNEKLQVIKVVGNKSLVPKCTKQVVDIMKGKRYRQVFPRYSVDESKKDIESQIFSTCSITNGLLTIDNSGKDTSFECFSKETDRDGIRGDYLFLDDIVQRSERMKIREHKKDIQAFRGTWKKRARDEKTFKIICGGTTYDPYDLLMTLKFDYSGGTFVKSKINKYTTLNKEGDAVFICVPKLDEKGKLTFPQKTVLKNVLKDKKDDYELFMAMDMQQPLAPKDTPFYWNYIQQYKFIPDSCSEYCLATLDSARTGNNYVSMPIFKKVKEVNNDGQIVDKYYLIDVLYEMATMDSLYGIICDLIERHHIIKLYIENNIDISLKYLLDKILAERGIKFCEITDGQSTKNKEERIYCNETLIKNTIVFPDRDMYGRESQIGVFMEHIISYKYKGAEYDDSIDSVTLFVDKFIRQDGEESAEIEIWDI